MTPTTPVKSVAAQEPGRLGKALIGLFMKRATITTIDDIANGFRLITLEGPALRGVARTPGQKVQVAMGSAFIARTYTPIEWDAAAGQTRVLGYAHGDGPGEPRNAITLAAREAALGNRTTILRESRAHPR